MNPRTLLCLFTALGGLHAQTAPSPSTSNASANQTDAPMELSPFVVTSDSDVGYLAGNTLAGSRLNTALKDTPASISVFTAEFLSDIGAFDISEAMSYAVNVEYQMDDDRATTPNGNETVAGYQRYRVRGLTASVAQNYFSWNIPAETALIERIEDSRGPNSVLFGIASPGGLINSMTKQAQPGRAFRRVSATVGSFDSYRGTLDVNQPLLDRKLAVRFNAVYNKTNSFRHWVYQEHQRAHLAAKYIVNDRTRVRAEFERGQINSNQPRHDNLYNFLLLWHYSGRPTFPTQVANAALGVARLSTNVNAPRVSYISNSDLTMATRGMMITNATGTYGTGPLTDPSLTDSSINIGGPSQDRYQRFDTFSVFAEHRFSPKTFVEVAFNHQDIKFDRLNPQVETPQRLRGDPNQRLNDGSLNPFAGQVYLEGGWQRNVSRNETNTGRAMFSHEFDAKKWGNYRFAALAEYEKGFDGNNGLEEYWVDAATGVPAFNPIAENGQNQALRRTYPIERDWATYYLVGPGRRGTGLLQNVREPITGRTLSTAWFPAGSGSPREIYSTRKAGMVAAQARYFGGKLILAGGLRRDDLDEYQQGRMRDPVTGAWTYARNPADADPATAPIWTNHVGRNMTMGVVYHPAAWLSFYYNRANNITLPANQLRLPDDGVPGNPLPISPPKGTGEDYGFGLSLLENRAYVRATYYTTRGERQSTTSPSAMRSANTRIMQALFDQGLINQSELTSRLDVGGHGLFDHASEGVELQVTANATKNWRFQASYAFLDAKEENLFLEWTAWHKQNVEYLSKFNTTGVVTSAGRTIPQEIEFYLPALEEYTENDGGIKMGSRRHKMNLFTRYNFSSGWLNGLYVGGGYRHQTKMFTGRNPLNGGAVWSPSFWNADALLGYTVRGFGKGRKLSFQLNVFNVFDDRDPLITRYEFVGNQQLVFRSIPQPPRTWRFTTNFEF